MDGTTTNLKSEEFFKTFVMISRNGNAMFCFQAASLLSTHIIECKL